MIKQDDEQTTLPGIRAKWNTSYWQPNVTNTRK